MTNLVRVPGRNTRSSHVGMCLNSAIPRIRYLPSSALMWMSSITEGGNMKFVPIWWGLRLIFCQAPLLFISS